MRRRPSRKGSAMASLPGARHDVHEPRWRAGRAWLATAFVLAACGGESASTVAVQPGGWHDFQGSWTAAGSVHTIALGNGRQASLADLRGTLILAGPARPGIGFRGDA